MIIKKIAESKSPQKHCWLYEVWVSSVILTRKPYFEKVYQKAVMTPMTNVETLWKDYITFEQGINPIIAEKMSMERSRDYMNARRVAKENEAITRGLNRNYPSIPPTGSQEEIRQVFSLFMINQ